MTDAKATDKEDRPLHPVEKQPLKTPDAQIVQNANAQQLQAALKANLDHHSGSAGGSDAESIQIHMAMVALPPGFHPSLRKLQVLASTSSWKNKKRKKIQSLVHELANLSNC